LSLTLRIAGEMLNNKRILITGGTGSFGKKFIQMVGATYPDADLIVYSRDEMKQWELKQKFPNVNFFLGDVRDLDRLKLAFEKVDIVVHAAALKIVPTGETDPMEYVKTNVNGAMNVINAAIEKKVGTVIALSTDKAVFPVNLYGATKLCSDKLFLAANQYSREIYEGTEPVGESGMKLVYTKKPVFSIVRYGNVMGSRGSVIPHFIERAKAGKCLNITDPRMTRFMMDLEDAVKMVWDAIEKNKPIIHIPKIPSMEIMTIAEAVWDYLDITDGCHKIIGRRDGEKMHESLSENYNSNENDQWMDKEALIKWMELNYEK